MAETRTTSTATEEIIKRKLDTDAVRYSSATHRTGHDSEDKTEHVKVRDWPKDLQKKRFKALTGIEPTDAELEMALDLNLL